MSHHQSVLLGPLARLLAGCRRVLDATAGGGGHARALAEGGAAVLGLDRDPAAVALAREGLADLGVEVRLADYAEAAADPVVRAFAPDGVLLDLGLSSLQLDEPARGFTFRRGAPLDMRFAPDQGLSAADLLNWEREDRIAALFRDYADERSARRLAREIARRRERRPFATSDDLIAAIRAVKGPRSGPGDFARLFQALRIAVNGELDRLAAALPALRDLLPPGSAGTPGGVLAVISYHSGEDRLVKRAFRDWASACVCPPRQPACTCRGRPLGRVLTRRPIGADPGELARNPRARSARLRAFQRGWAGGAGRGGAGPEP